MAWLSQQVGAPVGAVGAQNPCSLPLQHLLAALLLCSLLFKPFRLYHTALPDSAPPGNHYNAAAWICATSWAAPPRVTPLTAGSTELGGKHEMV